MMGCLRKLILGKQKLVRYALDVDKVEFDLLQDPECHGFHYVNVGLYSWRIGFRASIGEWYFDEDVATFCETAYVPLLGGSGPDVVQKFDLSKGHADDWDRVFDRLPTYPFWEDQGPDVVQDVGPIPKVMQMIGTESLIDCLRTSFGRIRSRRSSRVRPYPKVMQDDWDRVFDRLPTYLFKEDQVKT
uniref:Uncharacterized protein n=1 Tax=Fagus sylvatica TaxID=28930 RepID=A0A2N9GU82_FAGSY